MIFLIVIENNITEFVYDFDSIITIYNESGELFPTKFNLNIHVFNVTLNFDFVQLENPVNTSQVYLVSHNIQVTEQNFTRILVCIYLTFILIST